MKNNFTVHVFPKNFSLLGIEYDEGEGTNTETNETFPVHKISVGLIFIVFELIIFTKKGEK